MYVPATYSESFLFPAGEVGARSTVMRGIGKRFVYVLRSDLDPERHYIGVTGNVDERLKWHNAGPSGHTVEHRPWSVVVSIQFPTEKEAVRFEKYLKSGSGRAFAEAPLRRGYVARRTRRRFMPGD